MKTRFLNYIFCSALTIAVMSVRAQTTYTQGVITYKTGIQGQDIEVKEYFTPDSLATVFSAGPATIKLLTDANYDFYATLIDVPAFNIKKAAIYTPDEIKQAMSAFPAMTFSPDTATKQISGFNCKKVAATATQDNKTYDVWITNDIAVPPIALPIYYKDIGGFPVQYIAFSQGQSTEITVSGVSGDAAPVGIFSIPSDFDKVSKADLEKMSGGH